MRKWLSSLGYALVVLIVTFLSLPLLMGLLTERKCKQIVAVINTTTPFNIVITDYQRGWFNADATAQISLNDKLGIFNQQLQQLTVIAHIAHGPILIDWARCRFVQAMINATINLNAAQNSFLKRANDAGPIATTKIKFNLNGNSDITLDSPPLAYQDQENSLLWQGLKMKADFSSLCTQAKSKIEFFGADVSTKNRSFHLGKVKSLYQGGKMHNGLWVGERIIQLDSFSIKNERNHTTAFNGLNLHNLITDDHKNGVNITTTAAVDKLTLNDTDYNQSGLDFEIKGLNQELLTKLQQQLTSILSIKDIGFDTILNILNNGSEISINRLNTNTPWGKLLATIKITFAKQPGSNGLLTAVTGSTVTTDIKAEPALALHLLEKFYKISPSQQPDAQDPALLAKNRLDAWQQSGKITTSDQDNYLHLAMDYKNGQLLINNKQLVLTTKP